MSWKRMTAIAGSMALLAKAVQWWNEEYLRVDRDRVLSLLPPNGDIDRTMLVTQLLHAGQLPVQARTRVARKVDRMLFILEDEGLVELDTRLRPAYESVLSREEEILTVRRMQ